MSKYPYILFYHNDEFIESFFETNVSHLNCTLFFIKSAEELNKLYDFNYSLLVTYGPDESVFKCNQVIANRMRDRWIHFKEITDINKFNLAVNYCFINNCALPRIHVRPTFSIFTSCYNSYNKITRAYQSVKKQTFLDYEWVILDDSPDDFHFDFLRKMFQNDPKVRLYRRQNNSGNIGNVKNEAVSLCRGQYVLELDHDDEILPDVLKDSVVYFEANKEVGFIYMDFINIYENGDNFYYGNFICKGYGSYYTQKYNGRWVYVYNTPNINNVTLSHLVCCPNHPRIWRRSVLLEAGNYSEFLPICDDYEILLRTSVITKMAKIAKLGYVQYMNAENNNFSLIRNSEINRLGPEFIQPIFYDKFKINERMKELGGYDEVTQDSHIWKRQNYTPQFANNKVTFYPKQICIIGVNSIPKNLNLDYDYIVLDTIPLKKIQQILDSLGLTNFKCFSLPTYQELRSYFLMMYLSTDNYEIIDPFYVEYNTVIKDRHTIINKTTNKNSSYLEIGVEWGYTFKNVHFTDKTGVDPDPKCEENNFIVKMTSDEFFKTNKQQFDVIFIDGMHQAEYILRDINNAIKCLVPNGTIFIDDILPLNYNEQTKIPQNHMYENGILKYNGFPWTGDVWKVINHILQFYGDYFDFAHYNNANYRGVGMFKIKTPFEIPEAEIEIINNYTYFKKYTDLIKKCTQKINILRLWSSWDEYMPNTNVLLNDKFLIIQIPKTSTTMLLNNVKGKDMDCYRHECLSYIENFIKPELPVYAIVRNPYTHMYSYFFHCIDRKEIKVNVDLKQSFEDFVKDNIHNTHVRQYDYIHSNKGINVKIFKFEDSNFIDFLNKTYSMSLDKYEVLNENKHPLYNKSKQGIINMFSENTVKLIQVHRKKEFEMFGYSTLLLDISLPEKIEENKIFN